MKKIILLFISLFCYTFSSAQNIYPEVNYKFSLIKKGIKEVHVAQADVLKEVWKIDAKTRTISILKMKAKVEFEDYDFDSENMPEHDSDYFIVESAVWYFQKKGRIDSIITTENKVAFYGDSQEGGPYGDDMVGKVAHVYHKTSYCYSRKCLAVEKRWYSDEVFTGDKSITTFNCVRKRPTISTTNKGEYTEELLYDKKGRLLETKSGERTYRKYEYDQNGRLVHLFSGGSETNFKYNEIGLLVEVTKTEGRPQPYLYRYI